MSKAEDRALEALDMYAPEGINKQVGLVYTKAAMLGMFKDGYHQAEKDLTDKAKVSSGWDGFYYGQGYKQAEKDLEIAKEEIYEWLENHYRDYMYNPTGKKLEAFFGMDMITDLKQAMK